MSLMKWTVLMSLLLAGILSVGISPVLGANGCKPSIPLAQAKCNSDGQCCPGLVCEATNGFKYCRPGCRIGGTFYASGALNPANGCQSCQPSASTVAFTSRANGTACNDGLFCNGGDTCAGGTCTGHAGNPCPGPDGDVNCAESCNEAARNCTSADPSGSGCNDGNSCTTGETCDGSGSCGAGTAVTDGTPCNGGVCCGGTCAGSCAPRIIAISHQEGDVAPAGSLTFTATFSRAMRVANLDSSDVSLTNTTLGNSYAPASSSYDATGTVLTLSFSGLPDGAYTLTLFSGDGKFESASGFDLDGEPVAFPIPPNQTGDGAEGGNFVVHFALDITSSGFPVPLTAKAPPGGLIYDPTVTAGIEFAGDTDSYTLGLDATQTITILVTPSGSAPSLRSTVELRDPANNLVASATAPAAGETLLLETAPVASAGTFTIAIGGADGTTGGYSARAILNAAVEAEGAVSGASNNTRETAQDLDSSFIPILESGRRAAVLGGNAADSGTWHDYYRFTASTGDIGSVALTYLSGSGTDLSVENSSGAVLATGVAGAGNVSLSVGNFVFPASGNYFVHVSGSIASTYSLLVTLGGVFEIEPNSDLGPYDLGGASVVLGHVGGADAGDAFRINVRAGDRLSILTGTPADGPGEFVNVLNPSVRLFDPFGALVASGVVLADGRNEQITYSAPLDGSYRISLSAEGGTSGEYFLSARKDRPTLTR